MTRASFFSVLLLLSFLCAIVASFFACDSKHENTQESILKIRNFSVNGKRIEPRHEVELKDVEKIEAGDIKATFEYSQVEGEVELPLYVKNAPLKLRKDVPVRVEVYVLPKHGEYQGWQTSFNAILR